MTQNMQVDTRVGVTQSPEPVPSVEAGLSLLLVQEGNDFIFHLKIQKEGLLSEASKTWMSLNVICDKATGFGETRSLLAS